VGTGRARVAVSILDADLGSLAKEVRRAEKAGCDRIHLDVMDAHFVPNLTFGAKTIKALRPVTKLPFDAHLMISEPGRYVDEYIDAGCDSITFHVEIEEEIEPTLRRIREKGRAAGLAIKPATAVDALEPFRHLLDIAMVMTVEPGFGGQSFLEDSARKASRARALFDERAWGGELHVDGGVNRDTAAFAGAMGFDILVVGSALWKAVDLPDEVRTIKTLADEAYAEALNHGEPPIPRDNWVTFTSLPKAIGRRLMAEIEAAGVPVIQLRTDGQMNPDGERDFDLLIPATAEAVARERWSGSRDRALAEAEAWRAELRNRKTGGAAPATGTAPR
jgi:ribulose-phosphate 3-epimerase